MHEAKVTTYFYITIMQVFIKILEFDVNIWRNYFHEIIKFLEK